MSRVISFRLDEEDPDERAALDLLDRAIANGSTVRQAIVWALLVAGEIPPSTPDWRVGLAEIKSALVEQDNHTACELRSALHEARQIIDALKTVGLSSTPAPAQPPEQNEVSPAFKAAVKRAVKGGMRLA